MWLGILQTRNLENIQSIATLLFNIKRCEGKDGGAVNRQVIDGISFIHKELFTTFGELVNTFIKTSVTDNDIINIHNHLNQLPSF